jgi:hypothetical protein
MEAEAVVVKNYEVHLNTNDLLSDGSGLSRWQVSLRSAIETVKPNDYFAVQVSSAEIPYTWHDWSPTLDTVRLYMDGVLCFTLPEGYYTADEMATALSEEAAFPYTVTFSRRTGALLLENNDSTTHTINTTLSRFCRFLGLGSAVDVAIAGGSTVEAPYAFSNATVRSLQLRGSFPGDNAYTSTSYRYQIVQAQIIDKLAVDVNPEELLCWGAFNSSTFSVHVHTSSIKQFRLALTCQDGYEIALRQDCTITLQIDLMRPLMAQAATQRPQNPTQMSNVVRSKGSRLTDPFSQQLALGGLDGSFADEAYDAPLPVLPTIRDDDLQDLMLKAQALNLEAE